MKRHQLLALLSPMAIKMESGEHDDVMHAGLPYEDIVDKLNCTRRELSVIASELYRNDEIHHYNVGDIDGICCYKNGLASFANRKYKERYWKGFWGKCLLLVQISVPVFSLFVMIMTLIYSGSNRENMQNIENMQLQIDTLRSTLDSQTKEKQNYDETTFGIDSLLN
jgi:hypothetical protein